MGPREIGEKASNRGEGLLIAQGRTGLITPSLTNLPIYYLSIFMIPKRIAVATEQIGTQVRNC